jgi:hypothetical protein
MKRADIRMLLAIALSIATCLVLTAPDAHADSFTFTANLTGALESPATDSLGTGFASVVLDTVANTMRVNVTFSDLTGGTTASHIHCCLASPFLTGANVGVATTIPTFTDFPLMVTSGTYDHVFDLTLASSYNPMFDGATVASQEAALVTGIESGETYLNIHTTKYMSGEIRGFLVPTPEPSTLLLFDAGLIVLAGLAGRKLVQSLI